MTFPTPANELAFIVRYGYVALFALVMANEVSSFIPMGILLIAVGALARAHTLSFAIAFGVTTFASILADYIVFHISRHLGKRESYRRFVEGNRFATRIEGYMTKYPRTTVFISRLIGIASTPVNALAGLSQMPRAVFIIFGALGDAICCFAYLAAGYLVGTAWQQNAKITSIGIGVALAIAALGYLVSLYLRARAKRSR